MSGKGLDRPAVLACLAPVELIKKLKRELYVKGGDYDMEALQETRVVRSCGGDAVAIPFVDEFSTTYLFKRIRGG